MIHDYLFGFHKDAVSVLLDDALKRISVLKHLTPEYFCDSGALLNGLMNDKNILPTIFSTSSERGSHQESEKCNIEAKLLTSTRESTTYGMCGRFERQMCQILDSIELARAEITGVKAVQLPNGRIQYINDQQIRDRKLKEDLQSISSCLEHILSELDEEGTFVNLINYITEKHELFEKMELSANADKISEAEIHEKQQEIQDSKIEYKRSLSEFLALIQHLNHQKQELRQKNKMEYNFNKSKTNTDIEQLKLRVQSTENDIIDEMTNIQCLIGRENQVNTELSTFLRNCINTMEQSIEYWINVHSTESAKFQAKLKSLTKDFQVLTHELETLASKYVHYEKVCIEDRLQKAEQAKLDEIEKFLNSKAVIIQKWWRYVCVMLSIGPHGPKKKSKKGKGKKKGK